MILKANAIAAAMRRITDDHPDGNDIEAKVFIRIGTIGLVMPIDNIKLKNNVIEMEIK